MNTFNYISKHIAHLENNHFSYDSNKKKDDLCNFIKILFMNLTNKELYKNKFHFFINATSGFSEKVLGKKGKEEFEVIFCKIQKTYSAFQKLAFLYKWKKAKYNVVEDLCLNPISLDLKDVLCIFQNNNKYLFRIRELIKIIENALTNSPGFFCDPLKIKNPYNNMALNKSTLYNIYFFMNYNSYIYSELFHRFFICNFNMTKFFVENETLLREYAIDNYLRNASMIALYMDAMEMLDTYNEEPQVINGRNMILVHNDFPKKELVEIMKPYLKLYLNFIYNMTHVKKQHSKRILIKKLIAFNKYNKTFGRKFFNLGRNELGEVDMVADFDKKHVKFIQCSTDNFMTSHLQINNDFEEFIEEPIYNTRNTIIRHFVFSFPLTASNDTTEVEEYENSDNGSSLS
jgi:hypothetical protein